MPSLLSKYKKRRESHKGDDGSSVASHDADQRSPSGSSVRSGEAALGGAAGGGGLAAMANSQFSQLPQNAQNAAQQAAQQGQKVLHSPFLGQRSPQPPGNANAQSLNGQGASGQPGQQAANNSANPNAPAGPGSHASPHAPGSNGHTTSANNNKGYGSPSGPHPNVPPSLPPNAMQNAHLQPQHPQHSQGQPGMRGPGSGPQSPISPPPHGQAPMHGQPPHGRSPHGNSPNMYAAGVDPAHERDRQFQQRYRQPPHEAYKSPLTEPSETPWAEYPIQRACPSPRFGHSANYIAARDGELFIMGGIRDSDIMDDLWVIDTNMLTGYQLVTEGARVGARVGHSSLVLGNAHVMFGGDTKIEETDPLDDNLYLLNTSSLKWTVAQPVGPRPTGRYGHSLSNVGARIYVFGGQVDEQFYNDMWAFDLQSWRSPSARWELIHPTTEAPTPRTNHTVVTWNDKLYLFGGANGDLWYSDTWCFDPVLRRWDQLDCTGYVPAPCQGHAATIIGDVMYVFGGMSSQGILIDQLFALKLTTLKWYTFQNLGPGPSPRSGHSLTAFTADKILVWGGTDQGNSAYVLDVSRINYPDDHQETAAAHDAPAVLPPVRPPPSAESKDVSGEPSPQPRPQSLDNSGPTQGRANPAARNSMLFAKRGSVIAPSSPLRGLNSESQEQGGYPSIPPQNQTSQPHSQLSSVSGSPPSRSPQTASDERTPNRTHVTPTSYVSENEGSSDERFVSAVDLNEDQGNVNPLSQGNRSDAGPRRSRGHTRGQSLGGNMAKGDNGSLAENPDDSLDSAGSDGLSRNNTLTRADVPGADSQDQNFRNMESELSGMPGGLPRKPFMGTEEPAADQATGPLGGIDSPQNDNVPRSDGDGWNSADADDSLSSRTPGLRRSQPQTNLSLRNIDENDETQGSLPSSISNDNQDGEQDLGQNQARNQDKARHEAELAGAGIGAVGAAGAGIIGLSDQMNLPPHSHAVENTQKSEDVSGSTPGLSVGTPAAQDAESQVQPDNSRYQPSANGAAAFGTPGAPQVDRSVNDKSYGVPGSQEPVSRDATQQPKTSLETTSAPGSAEPVEIPSQSSRRHARTPSSVSGNVNGSSQGTPISEQVVRDPKSQSSPKEASSAQQHSVSTPRGLETASPAHNNLGMASPASASATAELAQLRQQLDAYRQRDLDGEHHKLKQAHAARERDLLDLRDSHGQLQSTHSKLTNQHQDLQQRYDHVQKLMDGHVNALQAQQRALEEAKAKIEEQQKELSRLPALQSENADLKHQLQVSESARKHAEEQLETLNKSHSDLRSAHSELNDKHAQLAAAGAGGAGLAAAGATDLDSQVNQLVQLWSEYNRGTTSGEPGTRELNAAAPGDDYRSLYETHKTAADSAQRELEAAYSEQAQLKAQLRDLSAAQSSAPSAADLDLLKEQHQNALSQLDQQHQEALLRAKSASSHDTDELRARLQRLEASYEELNTEYQQAVDLSKNQQSALAKTREELNMSRAHVQRLEEQLEDASIHAPPAIESGDVSAHSVSSARTDQAALVIRDLRTQIVILEEENQGQREQIMKLKKAALTPQ